MLQNILIAVDGSEGNKVAVDLGLEYAKAFNASVTAICVFDIRSYGIVGQPTVAGTEQAYMDNTFENAMAYVRTRAAAEGIPLTEKTVSGRPAETIAAESAKFDLVVCGTKGLTGAKRALMGSVAEVVVRTALCPVLVVRKTGKE